MSNNNEIILGIDLGTTNSAAAVYDGLAETIIPAKEGASLYGKSFPSCVAFADDGRVIVGEPAKSQWMSNPDNTILKVKRLMGSDEKIKVNNKIYTPEEISAFILQKIKSDAEDFLEEPITKAVISVPAYFDYDQRKATADAAELVGLKVMSLINEPNAAAIAYGIGLYQIEEKINILFFDFGGGTLDISVIELNNGKFDIKASVGDNELGGTDMDEVITDYLIEEFKQAEGIDLREDSEALSRIKEAAELAKIQLSSVLSYNIDLAFIAKDKNEEPKNLNITLTRNKLEELVFPIIKKTENTIRKALSDANMTREDIDKVILVGGPTRMPIVKDFVSNVIGKQIEGGVDPMECVAIGAAINAWSCNVATNSSYVIDIPAKEGEDKSLDLTGLAKAPYSIGVEADDGLNSKIINKYDTLPVEEYKTYTTSSDGQTKVRVKVLQGEAKRAKDAVKLGEIKLDGIECANQGEARILVTIKMDKDGLIEVTVKNKETGKEVSDAFEFKRDVSDKTFQKSQKKIAVNVENNKMKDEVDTLIHEANGIKNKYEDELSAYNLYLLDEAISELQRASGQSDADMVEEKISELNDIIDEIKEETILD